MSMTANDLAQRVPKAIRWNDRLDVSGALLHKLAIGRDIPNPKWIYAAATVWGVPSAVN